MCKCYIMANIKGFKFKTTSFHIIILIHGPLILYKEVLNFIETSFNPTKERDLINYIHNKK